MTKERANQARKTSRQKPRTGGALARLDRDIQAKIGQHLREMHDDIVQEGVPDRFAELLAGLDAAKDAERE